MNSSFRIHGLLAAVLFFVVMPIVLPAVGTQYPDLPTKKIVDDVNSYFLRRQTRENAWPTVLCDSIYAMSHLRMQSLTRNR